MRQDASERVLGSLLAEGSRADADGRRLFDSWGEPSSVSVVPGRVEVAGDGVRRFWALAPRTTRVTLNAEEVEFSMDADGYVHVPPESSGEDAGADGAGDVIDDGGEWPGDGDAGDAVDAPAADEAGGCTCIGAPPGSGPRLGGPATRITLSVLLARAHVRSRRRSSAGRLVGLALLALVCACSGGGSSDPCSGVLCSSRGFCLPSNGTPYCACIRGYRPSGLACEPYGTETDPCRLIDCMGHGTCRVVADGLTCDCSPGHHHPLEDPVCAAPYIECDLLCVPDRPDQPTDGPGESADVDEVPDGGTEPGADGDPDGEHPDGREDGGDPDVPAACPTGETDCDPDPLRLLCVDLANDPANCGACGSACGDAVAVCEAGTCSCGPFVDCDPGPGALCYEEGWLASDPRNCGTCGHSCEPGRICTAGACECAPMYVNCGETCFDADSNPAHCGRCAVVCDEAGATPFCDRATCQSSCSTALGFVACGRACVVLAEDRWNCGECFRECGADELCVSGECVAFHAALGCAGCPCRSCAASETCCPYPRAPVLSICLDAALDSCPP